MILIHLVETQGKNVEGCWCSLRQNMQVPFQENSDIQARGCEAVRHDIRSVRKSWTGQDNGSILLREMRELILSPYNNAIPCHQPYRRFLILGGHLVIGYRILDYEQDFEAGP